jgi:hypothetical protein
MTKRIVVAILFTILVAGCSGQKSIEVGSPDINESNIPTLTVASLLSDKIELRFNEEWELVEHDISGENLERAFFRPVNDVLQNRSIEVFLEKGKNISSPDQMERVGELISVTMSAKIDDLLITYDAIILPGEVDALPVQVLDKDTEKGIKTGDIGYRNELFPEKQNPKYSKPLSPQSDTGSDGELVLVDRGPTFQPILQPVISGAGGTPNVHGQPDIHDVHVVGEDDDDGNDDD